MYKFYSGDKDVKGKDKLNITEVSLEIIQV